MKSLVFVGALATAFPAFADVIDFTSLTFAGSAGTPEHHYSSVVASDYVFTALQPANVPLIVLASGDPNNADPGGATLGLRTVGPDLGVSFARVDGAAFDFSSVQVTHLSNALTSPGNGGTLKFTFDGVTALQTSYDINPGFQTYSLMGTGLHSVQITSNNYFQIDNLVVSNVPEAASWLYMAGGLGLFAVAAGRRKASILRNLRFLGSSFPTRLSAVAR